MRTKTYLAIACALLLVPACSNSKSESAPSEPDKSTAAESEEHSPTNGEWCAGHGVPESYCTKCHPELVSKFKEKGDWCAEHGFPESACPKCNPMEPPQEAAATSAVEPGTVIRFRQEAHEEVAGVETVRARKAAFDLSIETPARVEFDKNNLADIRSPVEGIVRDVAVDLGQEVEEGDRLFVLESTKVGELQSRVRAARQQVKTARANLDRQKKLAAKEISSKRDLELAEQEFEAASSKLEAAKSALQVVGASQSGSSGRFVVRAPIDGTVVRRPAVVGTLATAQNSLATVADVSRMWVFLEVPERDAALVSVGDKVTVKVDRPHETKLTGEATWIASEVDRSSRTVTVRAEVPNEEGTLRAHQYATGQVHVESPEQAVVVPRDAVQRYEGESVVFVRTGKGVYAPKPVRIGRSQGDAVQVIGDLRPGAPVVTTGAFLLKTELSRDAIGAGCCEVGGE